MREIPILFRMPMVQALLDGRKTQTRRTNKLNEVNKRPDDFLEPILDSSTGEWVSSSEHGAPQQVRVRCPYGKPGDLLWVRETWAPLGEKPNTAYMYKANVIQKYSRWKPSIHMPKAAARIWLLVEDVRVERLQDITEDGALAEGVLEYEDGTFKNYFTKRGLREQDGVELILAKGSFQSLICSINGMEVWDTDPWVWVVKFKVVSTTGREAVKI